MIMAYCSTWHQTTAVVNGVQPSSCDRFGQVLSTGCNHRSLLLTVIVSCVDNTFGMMPYLSKSWDSFFSH